MREDEGFVISYVFFEKFDRVCGMQIVFGGRDEGGGKEGFIGR